MTSVQSAAAQRGRHLPERLPHRASAGHAANGICPSLRLGGVFGRLIGRLARQSQSRMIVGEALVADLPESVA